MVSPSERMSNSHRCQCHHRLVWTILDRRRDRGVHSIAMMERTARLTRDPAVILDLSGSEKLSFYLRSAAFMAVVGVLLYVSLAAAYPPVHDALHDFRHALAIVPCH